MHEWGDPWFEKNGADLSDAITYIRKYCRRFGRFGGDAKEKYGTVRFYCRFHYMIHDLIWPGYYFCQYPLHFLWSWDVLIYSRNFFQPFRQLLQKWQHFIYRRAYKNAATRWPHLKTEIYVMADYDELLKNDFPFEEHWTKG